MDGRRSTCGLKYGDSYPSAALQSSLENRLIARQEETGSGLYSLRWKSSDILLGPSIYLLRALGDCSDGRSERDKDYRKNTDDQRSWMADSISEQTDSANEERLHSEFSGSSGMGDPDSDRKDKGQIPASFQSTQRARGVMP